MPFKIFKIHRKVLCSLQHFVFRPVDTIYNTDSARQLIFDDSFKNPIKSYVISKRFTVEFKTKQQTHNYLPSSQLQASIALVHHNKIQNKATV
jgi:hypothetical protein